MVKKLKKKSLTTLFPYITGNNTYLITLFLRYLLVIGGKGCFRGNISRYIIQRLALLVTRLKAIYNQLQANGLGYSDRSTYYKDWLCDLLIVIANIRRTGNWYRRNRVCNSFESGRASSIRGIKQRLPLCLLPRIYISSIVVLIYLTYRCILLYRPTFYFKFRSSITGQSFFSSK